MSERRRQVHVQAQLAAWIHSEDQGAESRREGPQGQIALKHPHPRGLVGFRASQADWHTDTRQRGDLRQVEEGAYGQEGRRGPSTAG
ncbi:unnamed protein product [Penicillium nalgiovense]|uniref:Uncharacterized protein n=1 Tax=Penicillium nalgiovense TaxID=60175 RepID=A0A9W4MIE6_PENNA|nr:unnamed protein product [Penicillium nalgiovense]CAG7950778.1 unnamed protein product [Penicillium nalgiovense]CAG8026296.1 unnamed protein product [Penicillium nalgiovense]CAG8036119.1 unnamed protein product [Penicillium nalgiovense]CAG8039622.1 unnamed protein product [Penicillium nalgiovense]